MSISVGTMYNTRKPVTIEVQEYKHATYDENGVMTYAGVVVGINNVGATVVMTETQFKEKYEV